MESVTFQVKRKGNRYSGEVGKFVTEPIGPVLCITRYTECGGFAG